MSMDASHGHHKHRQAALPPLQPPEKTYDPSTSTSTTTPQTIEIPHSPADSGAHSPSSGVSSPGYGFQTTPPTPTSPSKRSSSSDPKTSDGTSPKRLRVGEANTACPSPTGLCHTGITTPDEILEVPLERSIGVRPFQRHFRSRSLPATLRRRRPRPDFSPPQDPPVTLHTLRELDLHEIYRNPKLRHDVVFDSQLHFRPNLDGSRGRRKREQADAYWKLVLKECEIVFTNVRTRRGGINGITHPTKLETLFSTMRDILLTLVPKSDRLQVEAALDPPLLMQQLEHGVLDFKKLALWLAAVLKAHCAPMRDQWVEQMVTRIAYGVDHGKTAAFVDGLKIVFGILEAMKLDVANHQIRTLRPHLVSTAVQFEQGYFRDRIDSGRLNMKEPIAWFQNGVRNKCQHHNDPYYAFSQLSTELLTPSHFATYPATFTFDFERLDGIRDDIREATCLKVAILFFRQLVSPAKRDVDQASLENLRTELFAILSEEEGPYKWVKGSNAIALHLAQAAHEFTGKTGLVDTSDVKFAENWLSKHLRTDSPIYQKVEQGVVADITALVLNTMRSWSSLATSPILQAADINGSSIDPQSISQRISHIAFLHWRIFGKYYTAANTTA